jgi:dienelactone hydrolase
LTTVRAVPYSPGAPDKRFNRVRNTFDDQIRTPIMRYKLRFSTIFAFAIIARFLAAAPLEGTKPLTAEGDLAAKMVEGIDRYLNRELAASRERREAGWKWDYTPQSSLPTTDNAYRKRLRAILGVVDARVSKVEVQYVATTDEPSLVAKTSKYEIHAVRWPVLPGVDAEGLLLEPKQKPVTLIVALPDADWTPEMFVGLAPGVPVNQQFPRLLAENGCRVLVPTLIDRSDTRSANPQIARATNQPHREFVYRMSYELGRHIIGYEVQKTLAAVDWFTREQNWSRPASQHLEVGVVGYGEGGLLALYAKALDYRIRAALVSGYFGPREQLWQEPIYRNVWGLLRDFGDAELASMFEEFVMMDKEGGIPAAHGALAGYGGIFIEYARAPKIEGPPAPRDKRSGAAPGKITNPTVDEVQHEFDRQKGRGLSALAITPSNIAISQFYGFLKDGTDAEVVITTPNVPGAPVGLSYRTDPEARPIELRRHFDPAERQHRQFDQLVAFTQKLLRESEERRNETFWSKLDTSSLDKYRASTEPLRKRFWEEVIGKLPDLTVPSNPRTRQVYDEPKWIGYDVMLDVYPDVFASGILLIPKDLKPGEKRAVVVCQHGLEGRPTDVVDPKKPGRPYHAFGAQLADRGYIVYAPQNPYIGGDKFRVLQRKGNPLELSLFSFIVRQHERTLDWLATLPFVDPKRIAFYGLSYGGKTAMRVPALLDRYCLSICSGDFNEWIYKNASYDFRISYIYSNEYEMPEFNLGNTFNYAEMAALIAPRPFMVERGHDDGVGVDEWVAYEYAKVRRLYAMLKISDRTDIEFFPGVHEINGRGTFEFLDRHLRGAK